MVNMHIVFTQPASPSAHAGTSHSCSAGKREPLHIAHRTSHTSSAHSRSSHLRWRGSIAVTGANLSLSNRRVDIADQVKEILAGIQTKSMFRCAWAALPGGGETTARCAPPIPFPFPSPHCARRSVLSLTLSAFSWVPVAALDKLHAKHVLPGFSDRSAEEREIEAATTDVTKVCNRWLSLFSCFFLLSLLLAHL